MKPAVTPGGPLARALVSGLMRWVRWWSAPTRLRFASFIAALAWALHIRRRVTLDNLRLAYPDKPAAERLAIARGAYRTMAIAAFEAVTSDLLSDAELERAVAVADWRGLDRLLEARQPVLVVSAHLGSWELFAEVMARRGYAFSAVVRPLAGAFNEWVVRNRQRAGVELILQRGAVQGMLKALRAGRAVVQLIDQSLPAREAIWVPFFGRLASTTPAVSLAAIRTGAPVYVVVALRDGAGLRMHVEGPVKVPDGLERREAIAAHTAQLTAMIERFVRLAPEQWLWLHRRWKGVPPATEALSSSSP